MDGPVLTICANCHSEVPERPFCAVCGAQLGTPKQSRYRRGFAAAPDEPALAVAVVSTLFPRLPRADMHSFRLALWIGAIAIAVLAAAGYDPVALVLATVTIPLLVLIYLRDVDVWEDEPWRILAFTAVWGVLAGAAFGIGLQVAFGNSLSLASPDGAALLVRCVVAPVIGSALMVAGPLLLLRSRRFNDVLDGATFGALAAVTFAGAQVLAQSVDLLQGGLRPGGDTFSWVLRILLHGVVLPLIAAGSAAGLCGAFWLRRRAPVADQDKLGLVGRPIVAAAAFATLSVAATSALLLLDGLPRFIVEAALAIVSLLWLRLVIHLGLLEEEHELELDLAIDCPNCLRSTPPGRFCVECGVSLRALPKRPAAQIPGGAEVVVP